MMETILIDRIKDIVETPNVSDKVKIDALLQLDAEMYTELGITSTKSDKSETRRKSRIIYREIKKLDKRDGNLLLNHLDK